MTAKREKPNQIAFVILHYGDPAVTDLCVQSILRMECGQMPRPRIVVVDNDGRPGPKERESFAARYAEHPEAVVLRAPEGAGFSRANNLGYAWARERLHADCIILCNNDIEFIQTDFPARLERSVSRMRCQVLGPAIVRKCGREPQNPMDSRLRTVEEAHFTIRMNRAALAVFPAAWPFLRIQEKQQERKRLLWKKNNPDYYRRPQKHIIPFGACLIFAPSFVEKEEAAFEPETQFYYEEYLLAHRCFVKGYETGYDPSMRVLHETGSATRQSARGRRDQMRTMMERTMDACEIYLEVLENTRENDASNRSGSEAVRRCDVQPDRQCDA